MEQPTFGLDLQLGDGAEIEVFATVGELQDIGIPEISAVVVDSTTHKSAGRFKEKTATLKETGAVDFVIKLQTYAELTTLNDAIDLAAHNWKIKATNFETSTGKHAEWAFSAFLTRVKPVGGTPDGYFKAEGTLTITGAATLAEVSDS